jgi:hypothetical protein
LDAAQALLYLAGVVVRFEDGCRHRGEFASGPASITGIATLCVKQSSLDRGGLSVELTRAAMRQDVQEMHAAMVWRSLTPRLRAGRLALASVDRVVRDSIGVQARATRRL